MISNRTISYAQNREDIILDAFFDADEKGFYIDIGAYDPDYDSVTKLFYKKGWTGINVEPQANRYALFTAKRTKDININLGISDKNTTLTFRSYANQGLSTFSEEMKSGYEHEKSQQTDQYVESSLKVITLETLCKRHNVTQIQFMKVDVEGLEYEVLSGNDWSKYRPEVICIEANHVQKDWKKLLKANDYRLVFFDGLNEYYADSRTSRAQKFDYVESIVFKEPIVHFQLLEDFKQYDKIIAQLEKDKQLTESKLSDAIDTVYRLQSVLDQITPLKRHLKVSVRNKAKALDDRIVTKLQSKTLANKDRKKSRLLPAYIKGRKVSVKALRKMRSKAE